MCSVPPDTGFDELDDDDDVDDDELHAARTVVASAAAASPAKHLGALIMGMSSWVRKLTRARGANRRPRAVDHYLPGETVRFRR
jgi:predicted RNA-binding Zn ribbon-like protein